MAAKNIFIAFTGPPIDQPKAVHKIADCYELWNLAKLDLVEFISAIKGAIPPINETVVKRHYKREPSELDNSYGITNEQCGFRGKAGAIPGSVRSALRNESGHDSGMNPVTDSDFKSVTLGHLSEP